MSNEILDQFWNMPKTRKGKAEHRRMQREWKKVQRKERRSKKRIISVILTLLMVIAVIYIFCFQGNFPLFLFPLFLV